jgi:putative transposase
MNRDPQVPSAQTLRFLTFNVADWVDIFVRPLYKLVVVDTLNYHIQSKGLVIHAWCLMTNHLHLLAGSAEEVSFPVLIRDMKRHLTQKILEAISAEPDLRKQWMLERFELASMNMKRIEKYQLWENCTHPVLIQPGDQAQQQHYIEYIHHNPVRDKIVDRPEDYIFCSARDYKGIRGLVRISLLPMPKISAGSLGNFPGLLMN